MGMVGSEKKGLVYEAFVVLALSQLKCGTIEWQPSIPGVVAMQDVAVRRKGRLRFVFGITHWGSHEAAKMKFWRIHEDLLEVFSAVPEIAFGHVLFERNADADRNLSALVTDLCGGCAVNDENCAGIPELQRRVRTDEDVLAFGTGQEEVLDACRRLLRSDSGFRRAIGELSSTLRGVMGGHHRSQELLDALSKGATPMTARPAFRFSGPRSVEFKPALLSLLTVARTDVSTFATAAASNDRRQLGTLQGAVDAGLVLRRGILRDGMLTDRGALLGRQGADWIETQWRLIRTAVADPSHPAHSLKDHLDDLADPAAVERRIHELAKATSIQRVLALLESGVASHRLWPLDYFMAIERKRTKGGKFGFSKLSTELGIPYIGGISPLPSYASGDRSKLSSAQVRRLADIMKGRIKRWRDADCTVEKVCADRRTTLMKKLPILEITAEGWLKASCPGAEIERNVRVPHPRSDQVDNPSAGSTEFNLKVTLDGRESWLFVVASYDATHKQKEVAGRIRMAVATGRIAAAAKRYVIVDGDFLAEGDHDVRCRMLRDSGWDGAFYVDELDELASCITRETVAEQPRRSG